jgi:hypothetical protein
LEKQELERRRPPKRGANHQPAAKKRYLMGVRNVTN